LNTRPVGKFGRRNKMESVSKTVVKVFVYIFMYTVVIGYLYYFLEMLSPALRVVMVGFLMGLSILAGARLWKKIV
jgi:hypothetical protein